MNIPVILFAFSIVTKLNFHFKAWMEDLLEKMDMSRRDEESRDPAEMQVILVNIEGALL